MWSVFKNKQKKDFVWDLIVWDLFDSFTKTHLKNFTDES